MFSYDLCIFVIFICLTTFPRHRDALISASLVFQSPLKAAISLVSRLGWFHSFLGARPLPPPPTPPVVERGPIALRLSYQLPGEGENPSPCPDEKEAGVQRVQHLHLPWLQCWPDGEGAGTLILSKRKLRELDRKYVLRYPRTLCVIVDGKQRRFSCYKRSWSYLPCPLRLDLRLLIEAAAKSTSRTRLTEQYDSPINWLFLSPLLLRCLFLRSLLVF